MAVFVALGYITVGVRFAIITALLLLFIGACGIWSQSMITLSSVLVSVAVSSAVGPTSCPGRRKPSSGNCYAVCGIFLALTLLLGSLNLVQYSGWWPGFLDRNLLKTLHLQMGLLGWIGFLIFGVGFHVIPMFYLLSKPFSDKQARGILLTAFGSLSALSTGSILGMSKDWLLLFSLPGLASVFYFSYTLLRMLYQRKRKVHDSTLRLWQGGILALCLSLPLGLSHLVSPGQQWLFLFGIFFIGGFAISVSIGMLYKIVPFLIWFHRFSSLIGQIRVPLLKDLLPKRLPAIQAFLHGVSLLLVCSGIFLQEDLSIRIGAGLWMVSSLMLLIHLIFVVSHKPKIPAPHLG